MHWVSLIFVLVKGSMFKIKMQLIYDVQIYYSANGYNHRRTRNFTKTILMRPKQIHAGEAEPGSFAGTFFDTRVGLGQAARVMILLEVPNNHCKMVPSVVHCMTWKLL